MPDYYIPFFVTATVVVPGSPGYSMSMLALSVGIKAPLWPQILTKGGLIICRWVGERKGIHGFEKTVNNLQIFICIRFGVAF